MRTRNKIALAGFVVGVLSTAIYLLVRNAHYAHQQERPLASAPQSPGELEQLSKLVRSAWEGKSWDSSAGTGFLSEKNAGTYVVLRHQGKQLWRTWRDDKTRGAALHGAVLASREVAEDLGADDLRWEVFFVTARQPLSLPEETRRLNSNVHRGVVGLELSLGDKPERFSPTEALSTNRKNKRLVELYLQAKGAESKASSLQAAFLQGPQFLVSLSETREMFRGNTVVSIDDVDRAAIEGFGAGMEDWMRNSLHPDGRMTYLYWPSQGQEAPGRDNLIRQFMATLALVRIAKQSGSEEDWQRASGNIDYNIARYFRSYRINDVQQELGIVELHGKVKLGAVALAALSIIEHRDRDRWKAQELALRRTVDHLWHEDGSFTSFLLPQGRNDNQNFYPGEALLMWAILMEQEPDKELHERFMKSFRYYRGWHLDERVKNRRNPAFIPWHTQAYYSVWKSTKDKDLQDFILEMNRWLLDMQEWEESPYDDTRGRFYDSHRPFGPPHASATGVYLEGLIDAYLLAKEIGDEKLANRFATAIRRGLRSSIQLQFQDEVDTFYIHQKDRVLGGLRTTVYDNQIRCDNVQHTLMAVQKILASDLFGNSSEAPAQEE